MPRTALKNQQSLPGLDTEAFASAVKSFRDFGTKTRIAETRAETFEGAPVSVPTFINEFWTARQRQASSLHEISYRACFKPQLPRFFIERLTQPGEQVYDPFMGRGTTCLEAALLGRVPIGCDINPLSEVLVQPRLTPPLLEEIRMRLKTFEKVRGGEGPDELLTFYHPDTLRQIMALRSHFISNSKRLDPVDRWIRMVTLNRLTGHSPGFLSVYSLPPNQAVSVQSQKRINEKRKQVPPLRNAAAIIEKKSRQLLSDCNPAVRRNLLQMAKDAALLTSAAHDTSQIPSGSVALVVTSPPFLDVVQYATDNWLRCWFLGLDAKKVKLTVPNKLTDWQAEMTRVFRELYRVVRKGGHVAFEVGEVRRGKIRLEEAVLPCGIAAGFDPALILINSQQFTKTANCWGVDNNALGTNTNRIVLFAKRSTP